MQRNKVWTLKINRLATELRIVYVIWLFFFFYLSALLLSVLKAIWCSNKFSFKKRKERTTEEKRGVTKKKAKNTKISDSDKEKWNGKNYYILLLLFFLHLSLFLFVVLHIVSVLCGGWMPCQTARSMRARGHGGCCDMERKLKKPVAIWIYCSACPAHPRSTCVYMYVFEGSKIS